MASFLIRPFRPTDLAGIFTARSSAIRDICARDYNPAQIAAWADNWDDPVKQLPRFSNSKTWVAEVRGLIVGFTNLVGDGYVDTLYVHGAHQGCGMASGLLQALEAAARVQGLNRLHSEVSITARPFFERRGFTVVTPQTVTSNGQQYLNFRMEKRL